MATITGTNQLTLIELAKRKDPNGELAQIAEVLTEDNPIMLDAPWQEANGASYHKTTRRSSLPSGSWRKLNKGVSIDASTTIEVNEQIGMLEAWAYTDKTLAELAPNPAQFRNDEALAFVEGLSQTLASTVFYGNNGSDPEKFDGLSTRLDSLQTGHVISAGGSGNDLTSIYIVQWYGSSVRNGAFMIYPRGNPNMGVDHMDMGEDRVDDSDGNPYLAYVDHFKVHAGMVVKDERCLKRIANIESAGDSNIFNEDDIITALNQLRYGGRNSVIYVNRTVKTQMDIAAKDKNNVNYTTQNIFGVPVLTFQGVPVRVCDAILDTESAVA